MMINDARSLFTAEEIKSLSQRSTAKGLWAVCFSWLLIAACLAAAYISGAWWVTLLVWPIIGSRQLALAILMHEGAHRTLLANKQWNDRVGQWLCAWPVFNDMQAYRVHHLRHHRFAGTEEDPDLGLATGFPITRKRFYQNIFRDLTGQVGVKVLFGSLLMLAGQINYSAGSGVNRADHSNTPTSTRFKRAIVGLAGPVAMQLLILIVCTLIASPWLYLLWLGSWLTSYMLFVRWRCIAEHALYTSNKDNLQNARTTISNPLVRFFVAPLNVNYHLEHHLLMAVPFHQLPKMYQLLKEKGIYEREETLWAKGYRQVFTEISAS
jgi:fatty acid desaturase